jgi:hypothetical protein
MTYDGAAQAGTDLAHRRVQTIPERPTHRIEAQITRYGSRGPIYRVMHAGQVLLARSRCPLLDACRELLTQGLTGRLELWRPGNPSFDAAVDIQVGAQWTILETETESLRLVRWTPSPWNALSRRGVEARTATNGSPVPSPYPEIRADFRAGACPMIGGFLSKQSSRLEAQADAILERDAALLRDLGVHADALRRCYEELLRPRHNQDYVANLEAHEKDRTVVANVTATVHHVVDGGRSWLSIGMTDQRNHAAAAEAARVLGRHLEAPVYRHEDPKDATRFADRPQRQPPKHAFGREKRSNPK